MSKDPTSRTLLLLAGLALLGWAVWLVRDVLPPFLIALALAVLLDPVLDRMQRAGIRRWLAVLLTFGGFLAVFVGVIAILVPRAVAQVSDLVQNLELYSQRIQAAGDAWIAQNSALLERLNLPTTTSGLWQQYQDDILAYLRQGLQSLFAGLQEPASRIGWVVVVPIVILYLLADLDRIRTRVGYLIPDEHRPAVTQLGSRIGAVFLAYIRGLFWICAAYGTLCGVVLGFGFRMPHALILGLVACVLYAVPYLGQLTLIAVTALVAWATGHTLGYILGAAVALLVIGQLFDQLITPRVVGKQVGLHPVLGLFALMVGGQLFGLIGMVLAVPVAASARVVLVYLFPRLAEPIPAEPVPPTATESPSSASS
jgi:predicted PurR-regulated permease PerM